MKHTNWRVLICLALALLLAVPVFAGPEVKGYVTDEAGILDAMEWQRLEDIAQRISQEYEIGVYIVTVRDMQDYGYSDPFALGREIYLDSSMGIGPEADGILLLLSMQARDYALVVRGENAQAIFTNNRLMDMEDSFLPELGRNEWFGGFYEFLTWTEQYMAVGVPAGDALKDDDDPGLLGRLVLPFGISGLICGLLLIPMNNAKAKSSAGEYVPAGGVKIHRREDRYLHTTRTQRRVQSSSSGGAARSGGGFSGRSGKF